MSLQQPPCADTREGPVAALLRPAPADFSGGTSVNTQHQRNNGAAALSPLVGQRDEGQRHNTHALNPWLHRWLYRLKKYFLFVHVAYVLTILLVCAILTYISENHWGCGGGGGDGGVNATIQEVVTVEAQRWAAHADVAAGDGSLFAALPFSSSSSTASQQRQRLASSSTSSSCSLSFVDALFVAASAVSCTGLATVDVSKWNSFSAFVRNTATVLCGMVFTSGAMPLLRLFTLRRLRRETIVEDEDHPLLVSWKRTKATFISRIESTAMVSAAVTYGYFIFWHIVGAIAVYIAGRSGGGGSDFPTIPFSDAVEYTIAAFQNCGFVAMNPFAASASIVFLIGFLNAIGGSLYPVLLRGVFSLCLKGAELLEWRRVRQRQRLHGSGVYAYFGATAHHSHEHEDGLESALLGADGGGRSQSATPKLKPKSPSLSSSSAHRAADAEGEEGSHQLSSDGSRPVSMRAHSLGDATAAATAAAEAREVTNGGTTDAMVPRRRRSLFEGNAFGLASSAFFFTATPNAAPSTTAAAASAPTGSGNEVGGDEGALTAAEAALFLSSSDSDGEGGGGDAEGRRRRRKELMREIKARRQQKMQRRAARAATSSIWDSPATRGLPTYHKALLTINRAPEPSLYHFFLFSLHDTIYLAIAFAMINVAQMTPFLAQQWSGPDGVLAPFAPAQRVLVALSQSILVRFSGTTLVDVLKFSNVHVLCILFAMYIPVVPIPNARGKRQWKAMLKAGAMRLLTSRLFLLFFSASVIVWIEESRLRDEIEGTRFDITTRVLFETISGYATSGMTLPLASSPASLSSSFSVVGKLIIAANMVIGRHRWMDLGIDIGLDVLETSERQVAERLRRAELEAETEAEAAESAEGDNSAF